ncbi:ATP-dependent helicase [Sporobolomyces salmoneus]|uniref:ATP-dependent helicase n=1 Tax=Sporobolomyces salmoneus TaxID=183962 RepID=UPI003175A50C
MEPPDDLPDSDYVAPAAPATPSLSKPLKQSTLPIAPLDLSSLNPSQLEAVQAPLEGGTQLLAGPGSGKTKVLTTRVASLIRTEGIQAEKIVVVTFTNKAANEMKVRLSKILGKDETERVVMGTFHSVCVRYLRKYSKLVNLSSTFTIADRDDCLAIIKRILPQLPIPDSLKKDLKPPVYLDHISKCKARMISPDELARSHEGKWDQTKFEAISRVYEAYDKELERANSLDFDDLLLKGHELFSNHPRVVARIQSVLIDEFQDTNSVQYDLVKLITAPSNSLTIVGDPDQSIYGWRNAEVENLEKMVKDFQPCRQIFLEQNYRSTGAILGAALAVVRQDTKRINKSLHSSHPSGSSVVLHSAPDPQSEATFIASSIRHLVAHLGGLVSYKDFAILLRYGALSRAIEVGLQKGGVPSKMVGGHKFFERAEVKDLLSYLQLLSNPSYTPALQRVLNTPKRALGEKAQSSIFENARTNGLSPFEVCQRIGKGGGGVTLGAAQKKAVKGFVEVIEEGRKRAREGEDVVSLIDYILESTHYKAYLEKHQGTDANERWENVEELKNYAALVAEENPTDQEELRTEMEEVKIGAAAGEVKWEEDFGEEELPRKVASSVPGVTEPTSTTNPLETFLATSMLATDTETQTAQSDGNQDKVTISTCHAAKGLEFPIVFVPAVEDGTYPFFRATEPNEVDEERRLLYVAITRAQSFCFLSHSVSRMAAGQFQSKSLSPFLTTVSQTYPTLFVNKLQKITQKTREEMARVLGRPAPSEEEAKRRIELLAGEAPIPEPVSVTNSRSYPGSSFGVAGKVNGSGGFSNNGRWASSSQPLPQSQPVPAGAGGFQSARGMMGQHNYSVFKKPSIASNPAPAASASASTSTSTPGAFKPLRPNSTSSSSSDFKPFIPPKYLAPRQPSTSIPSLPPISHTRSTEEGPPAIVETRASMIRDAVLVNPKLEKPRFNPSTQRDLLSSFQQGGSSFLEEMKGLGSAEGSGKGREEIDLTISSDDPSIEGTSGGTVRRPPMSPKRPAKKAKK